MPLIAPRRRTATVGNHLQQSGTSESPGKDDSPRGTLALDLIFKKSNIFQAFTEQHPEEVDVDLSDIALHFARSLASVTAVRKTFHADVLLWLEDTSKLWKDMSKHVNLPLFNQVNNADDLVAFQTNGGFVAVAETEGRPGVYINFVKLFDGSVRWYLYVGKSNRSIASRQKGHKDSKKRNTRLYRALRTATSEKSFVVAALPIS